MEFESIVEMNRMQIIRRLSFEFMCMSFYLIEVDGEWNLEGGPQYERIVY